MLNYTLNPIYHLFHLQALLCLYYKLPYNMNHNLSHTINKPFLELIGVEIWLSVLIYIKHFS